MKKRIWGMLVAIAVVAAASCRQEEQPGHDPQNLDDGWPVSDPQTQGLDPARIDAAYREAGSLDNIYSLLVVKSGFLVAERYFNGRDVSLALKSAC